MNFMRKEREIAERWFPGLAERLQAVAFAEREGEDSPVVEIYRDFGGPSLLVPKAYGGKGATPAEAVAVHRVLGSLSPSLAIAATMHNFTVAFLAEYALYGDATKQFLIEIAQADLYLASGFAEGKSGANILEPLLKGVPSGNGYLVSGVKKPCSISASMDYLTGSVMLCDEKEQPVQRAILIVPAKAPGIRREPYWKIRSLAGAQSAEVKLENVFVSRDNLFVPAANVDLDQVEAGGFMWFELLVTASYLGIASGVVAKLYEHVRYSAVDRMSILSRLEAAAAALRGLARDMEQLANAADGEAAVANLLLTRYDIQRQLGEASYAAAELLGGIHFLTDPEIEYRLGACAALAFHPPSRMSVADAMDTYMKGGALALV